MRRLLGAFVVCCLIVAGTRYSTAQNYVQPVCPSSEPTATVGNANVQTCDSSGNANVNVKNTPGVNVQNTNPPIAMPSASAGASPPAQAPPIIAYLACLPPGGATPAATAGNAIMINCAGSGVLRVALPFSPPTPPAATVVATSIPTTGIMTSAKASAGVLVGATFTNSNATGVYCGVYNTASAPTLGGTAQVYVYVPPTSTLPVFVPPTLGATYGTGITAGCATSYAGSTGVAANTVFASIFYY